MKLSINSGNRKRYIIANEAQAAILVSSTGIVFSAYSLYFVSPMKTSQAFEFVRWTQPALFCCFGCFRERSTGATSRLARIVFFVAFTNFFLLSLQAQTVKSYKREDFDLSYFRVKKIGVAAAENVRQICNMHSIAVIDARADTSVVGLMQKKIIDPLSGLFNGAEKAQTEQRLNKKPIFVSIEGGLQQEATKFAQHAIAFSNDKKLPAVLMIIKKLWLSDELNLRDTAYVNSRFVKPANRDVWTSGIDVRIEFYLTDGENYYPLYRYDSVISKALTISEYGSEYIALALERAMQKLSVMDGKISIVRNRTKFTLEEILQHNQKEFTMPVLTDAVLAKGVYMNFDEFKKNNPSQAKFELKKEQLTDMLYIKEKDGTTQLTRNVWGYCDGRNAYIKSGDNFFLLQRNANAFYIFGAKMIKREEQTYYTNGTPRYSNGDFAAPVYYTRTRTAIQLEPFQLDWSNGRLY